MECASPVLWWPWGGFCEQKRRREMGVPRRLSTRHKTLCVKPEFKPSIQVDPDQCQISSFIADQKINGELRFHATVPEISIPNLYGFCHCLPSLSPKPGTYRAIVFGHVKAMKGHQSDVVVTMPNGV